MVMIALALTLLTVILLVSIALAGRSASVIDQPDRAVGYLVAERGSR